MAADMPSLSEKQALILDLLLAGHRYGMELVNASGGELGRSGIYVHLDRMEEKGLVASSLEEAPEGARGPQRRVYDVTGLGRRVLNARHAYVSVFNTAAQVSP